MVPEGRIDRQPAQQPLIRPQDLDEELAIVASGVEAEDPVVEVVAGREDEPQRPPLSLALVRQSGHGFREPPLRLVAGSVVTEHQERQRRRRRLLRRKGPQAKQLVRPVDRIAPGGAVDLELIAVLGVRGRQRHLQPVGRVRDKGGARDGPAREALEHAQLGAPMRRRGEAHVLEPHSERSQQLRTRSQPQAGRSPRVSRAAPGDDGALRRNVLDVDELAGSPREATRDQGQAGRESQDRRAGGGAAAKAAARDGDEGGRTGGRLGPVAKLAAGNGGPATSVSQGDALPRAAPRPRYDTAETGRAARPASRGPGSHLAPTRCGKPSYFNPMQFA